MKSLDLNETQTILTVISNGDRTTVLLNPNIFRDVHETLVPLFVLVHVSNSEIKHKNKMILKSSNLFFFFFFHKKSLQDFYRCHYQWECIRKTLVASVQQNTKMFPIHFLFRTKPEPVNHSYLVYI